MSIERLVRFASAALLGLVVVSAIVFATAVNTIRIGGGHELDIELSAELKADILPPPLFIVEPYAVAMEGFLHEEKRATSITRLKEMHRIYDQRTDYWGSRELDPEIKSSLADVERNADAFWKLLDEKALPIMQRGEEARYDEALEALASTYNAQRNAIAKLVTVTNRFKAEVRDDADFALEMWSIVLVLLGIALLGGVLAYGGILRRRVVSPLGELTATAQRLSAGEEAAIPLLDRTDELGGLAGAFDHFVQASAERREADRKDAAEKKAMVDTLAETLTRMSQGDLRKVLEADFQGEYSTLRENLNDAIVALREMVQHVVTSAGSIKLAAGEIADASADLSSRTQSNAAAIEETTAALTDVDRRVTSTRDAAQSTAESVARARSAVEQGLGKARSAAATMEEVREAAASVDGVMEALDRIAFQTRVLAMNAAVEAGHAGEAGKGFAVVADLVSQLASRAEQEARNAREQLTATSERIAQAVGSVGEVEEQFSDIVEDVASVSELIARLTDDAKAQAGAIAEISSAMRQMDISTQQNAAMVEQTSAAASNLLGDARELVDRAQSFKWNRREENRPVAVERRGIVAGEIRHAA
ncbi:methyl-accepting chemotaxis protein [Sphingomonas astaxanthinifaciens]|uniref:Methyl-accepting chemotaxis protein n=1 Tax=Sphingomonas astaxanthinifaciens DSM 22298 TaxID=1123267 RepID=A0ABQ5Z3Y6_9SPHN|nr:methyl-accepting chemotaxis protein [Sphingomonas astaxanthinifaciens]GLR47503.1 methyl-accepting chemotaxis protein [Sphingomonas astaxanthinifaciens DSM 22298]